MENLVFRAQKIIDSYEDLPETPAIRSSFIEEIAELIVDEVLSQEEHIENFDFELFFDSLELALIHY